MFGLAPLGAVAFGGVLALVSTGLVERTLVYADHGWPSEPGDTPASTTIESRLQPFRLNSEIGTNDRGFWLGASPTEFGQVTLDNADGALDSLLESSFSDGRTVRLKVAPVTIDAYGRRRPPALSQFGRLVEAVAEQWISDGGTPVLRLRGPLSKLDRPIQGTRYGGSGGADGTAEMAGLTKPYAVGYCLNIPVQPVDPVGQIFQLTAGPAHSIVEVRDGGFPLGAEQEVDSYLALVDAEPSPGFYAYWLEGCFIKAGSPPVYRLTADIEAGDGSESTSFFDDGSTWDDGSGFGSLVVSQYVETAAGIIARIIRERASQSAAAIETTSFERLDRDVSGRVGWFQPAGGEATVLQAVDEIAASAGAWLADDSFGRFQVGRLGPVPTTAQRRLTANHITRLLRVDLPYRVPPSQVQVNYARNWTVQRQDELAADASSEAKQSAVVEYRQASIGNVQVQAAFPSARPLLVNSLFADREDALALAQHLVGTYSLRRKLITIETSLLGANIRRGQSLHVTYPAAGFRNGGFCTVIGVELSTETRSCRITALA